MTAKKRAVTAIILVVALALCIVGGGIFVIHGSSHACTHYGCRVCFVIIQIRAIVSEICLMPAFFLAAALISAAAVFSVRIKSAYSGAVTPVSLKVKLSS